MKSYRDLEIYQESKRLAIRVHKMTLHLPKYELYEEGSQVRRSSKAITSMIVEGYGRRRYKADFVRHLIFSQSECDETVLHLEFILETESAQDREEAQALISSYIALSKRINTYTQWVEENWEVDKKEITKEKDDEIDIKSFRL
jgi:four helix bundle protein